MATISESLIQNIPAIFYRCNCDENWTMHFMTEAIQELTGYPASDFINNRVRTYTSIIHPEDVNHVETSAHNAVKQKTAWEIEYRLITKAGAVIWVYEKGVATFSSTDEPIYLEGFIMDINGRKKSEQALACEREKLSYQASHDMLTGLINRHEFERRLENTLTLTDSDQSTHAVFFIDLDQFKVINDTCGHIAGDQLLQQVGNVMREQVRQQDCVARLGGDEFAILMQYCSLEKAGNIADKLRKAIDDSFFPWEGRQFQLTVSIGVVSVDDTDSCSSDILRNADTACYFAKNMGRNRIQVNQKDDETVAHHQREMRWVSKIHAGIEERRFILFAQIIESLNSQSPEKHVELLLRYATEDGNILPPGAFLPAAERYGISSKLDRYVIDTALTLLDNNLFLLNDIDAICINLSGLSLGDEEFLQFVIKQFDAHPSLPGKICFEITETAAISNIQKAGQFITKLKFIGCRFALDDFGSGLSSFGYLKNLPVDYLKIDGSFVRDIVTDPIDLAMVRSINDIGQLMGKKTIAEFVENDAIKQKLQQLGVDYVQGYGIGKPFPLTELIDDLLKEDVNVRQSNGAI